MVDLLKGRIMFTENWPAGDALHVATEAAVSVADSVADSTSEDPASTVLVVVVVLPMQSADGNHKRLATIIAAILFASTDSAGARQRNSDGAAQAYVATHSGFYHKPTLLYYIIV